MSDHLTGWKERASAAYPENKAVLDKLKQAKNKGKVDALFHTAHEQAFEEIDCLQCANCCKTTSPLLLSADIERLAASQRMRPADFTEKYLLLDEDGDYVFKSAPCPFLASDNYCLVYDDRPKACREYPHTNRKKMQGILALTLRNTLVCPAVVRVLELIKQDIG